MSAETVVPVRVGMDVRRMAACAAIAASALLLMAECGNDNDRGGGGRSPIDTTGVPGSGYQPPQRFHTPKGMGQLPPAESVTEQKQIVWPLGHTAADLPDFGAFEPYALAAVYEA